MAYKIFLDVNIMADFLDTDRKEHVTATALFSAIEKQKVKAYFSESVINTTAYILRKIIETEAFKILMGDLLAIIKVLPCTNKIVKTAYLNAKNDLEDAVLYQIALNGKVDYFITNDNKDFQKLAHQSLPVLSAGKFLELI
ncbi:MAG: PIN domain-containing protein [Sphingobacteriaceae bacterium]|nr:MAG: PIN domain-containing protein [Sphingobacteriaceae bacterium]